MSHLEERMETDLNYIRDWVWNIGEDVEEALRDAKKLLVLKDPEKAYEIILGDHPINRASLRRSRNCVVMPITSTMRNRKRSGVMTNTFARRDESQTGVMSP